MLSADLSLTIFTNNKTYIYPESPAITKKQITQLNVKGLHAGRTPSPPFSYAAKPFSECLLEFGKRTKVVNEGK